MNQTDRDIIHTAATVVRHWAEARAEGTYMEDDLCGMCAIASAELFKHMRRLGYKAELHVWTNPKDKSSSHCFVVVDDYVIDVTATQFWQLKTIEVFFEHIRMAAAEYTWYNAQEVFDDVQKLVKWQKKVRWASDQIAMA